MRLLQRTPGKREQYITLAAILAIFGFLLYRFTISPELKRISSARFHFNSRQALLELIAEKANLGATSLASPNATDGKTKLLFTEDEAMDFLRLLPQLINRTGNVLITMTPYDMEAPSSGNADASESKKSEPYYMQMPVQITIRGEYDEVVRFLEHLEEHEQLITIGGINIFTAEDQIGGTERNPRDVSSVLSLVLWTSAGKSYSDASDLNSHISHYKPHKIPSKEFGREAPFKPLVTERSSDMGHATNDTKIPPDPPLVKGGQGGCSRSGSQPHPPDCDICCK